MSDTPRTTPLDDEEDRETGDIWLGDVIDCWRQLEAGTEEDRRLIARVLGFHYELTTEAAQSAVVLTPPVEVTPAPPESSPDPVRTPAAPTPSRAGSDPGPSTRFLPLRFEPRRTPSPAASPAWALVSEPLTSDEPRHIAYTPSPEPLFRRGWTRGLLGALCATRAAEGPIDFARLIEAICSGRPATELPRAGIWTLRRGVQLLVEQSEEFAYFNDDASRLVADLRQTVGQDRTELWRFNRVPEIGAEMIAGPERLYRLPAPGAPIVVVSAFGLTRGALTRGGPARSDWRRFARIAKANDHPVVGIAPSSPDRWPMSLRRVMPLIQWDLTANATLARQAARGEGVA